MDRAEKESLVSSVRSSLQGANLVVVTRQVGLTVKEVSDLRRQMRQAGANYKVVKNSLAKLAVKDTPYSNLVEYLNGPSAIAFSEDPVAAARVAVNFAKDNDKIEVIVGSFGEQLLDVPGVQALAKLPSLDELRAKIIGVVTAPATKVAQVLQAPAGQLARVCGAYGSSGS